MENILFINSCIRAEDISRTYRICKAFLDRYTQLHDETTVTEIVLTAILTKEYDNPIFDYAKQFANADKIIIGAPLWDLSFPSILKVYIEHICVNTVTFMYENGMPVGLSNFSKLMYISTSGGFVGEKYFGTEYVEGIAKFLGSGEFLSLNVQGLDIEGMDVETLMSSAAAKAVQFAEEF